MISDIFLGFLFKNCFGRLKPTLKLDIVLLNPKLWLCDWLQLWTFSFSKGEELFCDDDPHMSSEVQEESDKIVG